MRTDDLVRMLATGADGVVSGSAVMRFLAALGWGAFGATLLMAIMLGVRPDIDAASRVPMFWVKLAFPAALAIGALWAALRLSHPGRRLGAVPVLLAAPVAVMWLLAAAALVDAGPQARTSLILGVSWDSCPFNIALLSLPLFAAALWAMRGLAPTRLILAGAAAGLLAGAGGAFVYAFYCIEMAAPFLGLWYVTGMLIPTAAGALIGPIVLRW